MPDLKLPDLTSEYQLAESKIASFRENGHVLLRGVCSAEEIAAYRTVINDATYRFNTEKRRMEERDTYARAFLQVMNLWQRDDAVRHFVLAKRFGKIAADLMGTSGVRLYHDQALYKEAGGGITPWHQDQFYWPLGTPNTVTMWMPLVDVPIEMGALTFASTSQRGGLLGHLAISDESESEWAKLVKDREYPVTNEVMSAGDATFHSGWTLHSAPGNSGSQTREVMTIIYFEDGAKTILPDNPARAEDLANWLPGVNGGELAASPLNPVIYRR